MLYKDGLKGKIITFFTTENVCIWMSPAGVTIGPSFWLKGQIKTCLEWLWEFMQWQEKQKHSYLRLSRRALSRESRSLGRISLLLTSSSAIFSATEARVLAFMSKMMAPKIQGLWLLQLQIDQPDTRSAWMLFSSSVTALKSPVFIARRTWSKLLKVR